jgi:hypothetical protein
MPPEELEKARLTPRSDSFIFLRAMRLYNLEDVCVAAKRETFTGKCEASAFLAMIGKRDVSKLAHELNQYALDAGLVEGLGQVEIQHIIIESIATAREAFTAAECPS